MIHPVQLQSTFIGKGEATTKTILQTVLNIQEREIAELPVKEIF